jgi:hypothetical protein
MKQKPYRKEFVGPILRTLARFKKIKEKLGLEQSYHRISTEFDEIDEAIKKRQVLVDIVSISLETAATDSKDNHLIKTLMESLASAPQTDGPPLCVNQHKSIDDLRRSCSKIRRAGILVLVELVEKYSDRGLLDQLARGCLVFVNIRSDSKESRSFDLGSNEKPWIVRYVPLKEISEIGFDNWLRNESWYPELQIIGLASELLATRNLAVALTSLMERELWLLNCRRQILDAMKRQADQSNLNNRDSILERFEPVVNRASILGRRRLETELQREFSARENQLWPALERILETANTIEVTKDRKTHLEVDNEGIGRLVREIQRELISVGSKAADDVGSVLDHEIIKEWLQELETEGLGFSNKDCFNKLDTSSIRNVVINKAQLKSLELDLPKVSIAGALEHTQRTIAPFRSIVGLLMGGVVGVAGWTIYASEAKVLKATAALVLILATIGLVSRAWMSLHKERQRILQTQRAEFRKLLVERLASMVGSIRTELVSVFEDDMLSASDRFKNSSLTPAIEEFKKQTAAELKGRIDAIGRDIVNVDIRRKGLEEGLKETGETITKWKLDAESLLTELREQVILLNG